LHQQIQQLQQINLPTQMPKLPSPAPSLSSSIVPPLNVNTRFNNANPGLGIGQMDHDQFVADSDAMTNYRRQLAVKYLKQFAPN
jgi:hypothetical protein